MVEAERVEERVRARREGTRIVVLGFFQLLCNIAEEEKERKKERLDRS